MNTIVVVGLGHVDLPLVVEIDKRVRTIGFDFAKSKVHARRQAECTDDPKRLGTPETLEKAARFYEKIIVPGLYRASPTMAAFDESAMRAAGYRVRRHRAP